MTDRGTESSGCIGRLSRQTVGDDGESAAVDYSSGGRLLIVCGDGQPVRMWRDLSLPHGTWLVVSDPDQDALPESEADIVRVFGRVSALEGWLGAFRATVERRMGAGFATGQSCGFDLVIDLSRRPLIPATVPPFGYFSPRSDDEILQALANCRRLVGAFRKPKYFNYEQRLCAHEAFGQPGCTRCLDVCAAGAISSAGSRIEVNPHLCQGCAACTLACPTGALSFVAPAREQLLAAIAARIDPDAAAYPNLIVHGPNADLQHSLPAGSVSLAVEPLAAFGEELWFAALASGAGRVVLALDASLPPDSRQLIANKLELARSMLVALGRPADSICTMDQFEKLHESDAGAGPGLPPAARNLPIHHKRALLTRAIASLEAGAEFEPQALVSGAPLGAIRVDRSRCTLCSACAQICPTAAIRYGEDADAGRARLAFAEELCVQCGACVAACPEDAIELEPRLAPLSIRGYWRVVSEDEMARCTDCARPFVAHRLLQANQQRAYGQAEAALVQLGRCPDCRARRIGEN